MKNHYVSRSVVESHVDLHPLVCHLLQLSGGTGDDYLPLVLRVTTKRTAGNPQWATIGRQRNAMAFRRRADGGQILCAGWDGCDLDMQWQGCMRS